MCKGSEGMFNVFAVYDICRSDLSRFAGLRRGEDDNGPPGGANINYVSISGTDPKGTVPAASKLAVTLFKVADAAAINHKNSMIQIPHFCISYSGENGTAEKTIMGKDWWLPWHVEKDPNAAAEQLMEEETKEEIVPTNKPVQAYVPPSKPAVTILTPSGKWAPQLCKPIMFGNGSFPLIGKFPNLEELFKLKKPPKLTQIKYRHLSNDSALHSI